MYASATSLRAIRSLRASALHCSILANRSVILGYRQYSSIEDFQKSKKRYSYGIDLDNVKEPEEQPAPSNRDRIDVNAELEGHPALAGVDPSSPEYKDLLYSLNEEFQAKTRQDQKRYEARERWKAVALGLSLMGGIVITHQLFMNWEYFKNWVFHSSTYGSELNDKKIKSLDDPSMNTNNINNLISKMTDDITTEEVLSNLKPSAETPGLYLFGGNYESKTTVKSPLRVPFFDDKVLRDVQLTGDYLVAVNEKGNQLFEMTVGKSGPSTGKSNEVSTVSLPFKATKAKLTPEYIYLLSDRGDLYYKVRDDRSDQNVPLEGYSYRNYIGLKRTSAVFGKFDVGSAISDISTGESHILLVTKDGRLFVSNTSPSPVNNGQYGLPKYSPFASSDSSALTTSKSIPPINTALELTGLNYELVQAPNGSKSTRQRVFTRIATGDYHNLAADVSGNVWTWGKNTFGECGQELTYRTDIKSVPQVAFTPQSFIDSTKHITLPNSKSNLGAMEGYNVVQNWNVDGLFAATETSYVKVTFGNTYDYLFSFGNGVKGQLGNNLYLHVCPRPQVMKSLLGNFEYDEKTNKSVAIGIKDIEVGGEHGFIVLNNAGDGSDVLAFGDNEFGQLGNGKVVKNSKPNSIPKLIEPEELQPAAAAGKGELQKAKKKSTKRMLDVNTQRLQLVSNKKKGWEQSIAAGETCSAIYYKPHN